MLSGYLKTGLFNPQDEENWNELTRNFKGSAWDIFDTRSPYTTAFKIAQQRQTIENPFLNDSSYHSVYTPYLIRYTP